MSAHTVTGILGFANLQGAEKIAIIKASLSASYDAGGSAIDLSTAGVLAGNGFTTVTGVQFAGHETAASSKYECVFIPAALNAAATPLIKVHDNSQAADAEASGDLHATVVRLVVTGT